MKPGSGMGGHFSYRCSIISHAFNLYDQSWKQGIPPVFLWYSWYCGLVVKPSVGRFVSHCLENNSQSQSQCCKQSTMWFRVRDGFRCSPTSYADSCVYSTVWIFLEPTANRDMEITRRWVDMFNSLHAKGSCSKNFNYLKKGHFPSANIFKLFTCVYFK